MMELKKVSEVPPPPTGQLIPSWSGGKPTDDNNDNKRFNPINQVFKNGIYKGLR